MKRTDSDQYYFNAAQKAKSIAVKHIDAFFTTLVNGEVVFAKLKFARFSGEASEREKE